MRCDGKVRGPRNRIMIEKQIRIATAIDRRGYLDITGRVTGIPLRPIGQ